MTGASSEVIANLFLAAVAVGVIAWWALRLVRRRRERCKHQWRQVGELRLLRRGAMPAPFFECSRCRQTAVRDRVPLHHREA